MPARRTANLKDHKILARSFLRTATDADCDKIAEMAYAAQLAGDDDRANIVHQASVYFGTPCRCRICRTRA